MFFYELHEGDSELLADALLVHELEFDEQEFLELVLEARGRVLGRFEQDTLVEAIARELEREHGFVFVDDARLRVAVNVSEEEGGTFLARVDETGGGGAGGDETGGDETGGDEEDEDDEETGAYRTLLLDVDPAFDLRERN